MKNVPGPWIASDELGQAGKDYCFDALSVCSGPLKELGLCLELECLRAEIFLSVQGGGFYVRGSLQGLYSQPCVRCLDLVRIDLSRDFELFEECSLPLSPDRIDFVQETARGWALNVHAILWEQFVLALPQRVVCREDCRGLCPQCGTDLNKGACECMKEVQDPRLEILRRLKL